MEHLYHGCGVSGPDTLRSVELENSGCRQSELLHVGFGASIPHLLARPSYNGCDQSHRYRQVEPPGSTIMNANSLCARRRVGRATDPTACHPNQLRHAVAGGHRACIADTPPVPKVLGVIEWAKLPKLWLRSRWKRGEATVAMALLRLHPRRSRAQRSRGFSDRPAN